MSKALAVWGLQAADPEDVTVEEEFYLWPECVPTFQLWNVVQTQWREDVSGRRTGLDYAGLKACMDMQQIPDDERAALFWGVRVMERAALKEWYPR